jgi:hypothetical protein
MRSAKVPCRNCGRQFAPTKRGRVRAHECPHGWICVPPRSSRGKRQMCPTCFESRQVRLFESFDLNADGGLRGQGIVQGMRVEREDGHVAVMQLTLELNRDR